MCSIAFGFEGYDKARLYIELVEIIYFFDIIMNFLTERRHQDTGAPVYSLKDIALMYIIKEKTFGVHLLTAFPY